MARSWADFYRGVLGSHPDLEGNIVAHAALIEEVARHVRVGSRVLEIGSGTGVLGIPLALAGVKVVSIDNDQEILDMARANVELLGAEIEFRLGDAFKLPFGDGAFDVVFSEGLLEHYPDSEIVQLVREHQRVGRVVVVSVPLKGCQDPAFGNERWMTLLEWQVKMEKLGLIKCFPYRFATRACFTLRGME